MYHHVGYRGAVAIFAALLLTTIIFGYATPYSYNNNASALKTYSVSNPPKGPNNGWSQWLDNFYKNGKINATSPMVSNLVWVRNFPVGNYSTIKTPHYNLPNAPEMIAYNGSIIFGGVNTTALYSVNAENGNVRWVFNAGPGLTFNTSAVAYDNEVVAVANAQAYAGGSVYEYVINATTGGNATPGNIISQTSNPPTYATDSILLVPPGSTITSPYADISVWSSGNGDNLVYYKFSSGSYNSGGKHFNGPVLGGSAYDGNQYVYLFANSNGNTNTEGQFNPSGSSNNRINKPTGTNAYVSFTSPVFINNKGSLFYFYYYGAGGPAKQWWVVDYFNNATNSFTVTKTTSLSVAKSGNAVYPTSNYIFGTPVYYDSYFFVPVVDANLPKPSPLIANGGNGILNYSVTSLEGGGGPVNPESAFVDKAPIYASPVISNGILYDADSFGRVYALNATNFNVLWVYNTSAPIYTTPIIYKGNLYVYNSAGSLFCFRTPKLTGNVIFSQNNVLLNVPVAVNSGSVLNISVQIGWNNNSKSNPFTAVENGGVEIKSLDGGNFSNGMVSVQGYTDISGTVSFNWTAPVVSQNTTVAFQIYMSTGKNKAYFYPAIIYRFITVKAGNAVRIKSFTAAPPQINMGMQNYSNLTITVGNIPQTGWNLSLAITYGKGNGTLNATYFAGIKGQSRIVRYNVTAPIEKGVSVSISAVVSAKGYLNSTANITLAIVPGNVSLAVKATSPIIADGLNSTIVITVKNSYSSSALQDIHVNVTAASPLYGQLNDRSIYYSTVTGSTGTFTLYFVPNTGVFNESQVITVKAWGANYTNSTCTESIFIAQALLNVSVGLNSSYIRPGGNASGSIAVSYGGSPVSSASIAISYTAGYGTLHYNATTNANGKAYFYFDSAPNIYNATNITMFITASSSSKLPYGNGSASNVIYIVPNGTYPYIPVRGIVSVKNPVINFSAGIYSSTIRLSAENNSSSYLNSVIAKVTISDPHAGILTAGGKALSNSSVENFNGNLSMNFVANSSSVPRTVFISFVLSRSGYLNTTVVANITVLPANIILIVNSSTVNESMGQYGWLNGSVRNVYTGNPNGSVYVNISIQSGSYSTFTHNGFFSIRYKISPVSKVTVYNATLYAYGNYTYSAGAIAHITVMPASYSIVLGSMPGVIDTAVENQYTFTVNVFNKFTGYLPAIAYYKISLSNASLGSLSWSNGNFTAFKADTFNVSSGVRSGIESVTASAALANGTAAGNSTITLIYSNLKPAILIRIYSTPVIYLKNPRNGNITVQALNSSSLQPVSGVNLTLSISTPAYGYLANYTGVTNSNGLFSTTFVTNRSSSASYANVTVMVDGRLNGYASGSNSTAIFIDGVVSVENGLQIEVLPANATIYPGSTINITVLTTVDGSPTGSVLINITLLNVTDGAISAVSGYTNGSGMLSFTFTSYSVNASFTVESMLINGHLKGYYDQTVGYNVAITKAAGSVQPVIGMSVLQMDRNSYSNGYLNISLRFYDLYTGSYIGNVSVWINITSSLLSYHKILNSSQLGYVNYTLHLPAIKSNVTALLTINGSKKGYMPVTGSYRIGLQSASPFGSRASTTVTPSANAGYPWWLILLLVIVLIAVSFLYVTARRRLPSEKAAEGESVSEEAAVAPPTSPASSAAVAERPVQKPVILGEVKPEGTEVHTLPVIIGSESAGKEDEETEGIHEVPVYETDLNSYPAAAEFQDRYSYSNRFAEIYSEGIPETIVTDEEYSEFVYWTKGIELEILNSYPSGRAGLVASSDEPWVTAQRNEIRAGPGSVDNDYPSAIYRGDIDSMVNQPKVLGVKKEAKEVKTTGQEVKEGKGKKTGKKGRAKAKADGEKKKGKKR